MTISVAILGATGYTGAELIRLLDAHPHFEITHLAAHSQAGKKVAEVLPGISGTVADMTLAAADTPLSEDAELVFTALPHGAAAESVKKALDAGKRVVDLSADFRHRQAATYKAAYGADHPCPELFEQAVYGLGEFARNNISGARLVANPGCYPTSTLLPLVPLLKAGVLDTGSIIVDSKSGVSGAGRSAATDLLYCELNESVKAYGLPRHRHAWEMEEWAAGFGGSGVTIRFVPHILPMTRGMLTTLHLSGNNPDSWHTLLAEAFADETFVRILPEGNLPSTHGVSGSNRCDIGISVLDDRHAVVVSCLDNLLKGAAGQAVQNANIMFGFEETLSLSVQAIWP
ncbi:MAG: N-acetyl-gamma-glutamyl-phosphate reductase [Mariprofundaceae bacterium]|nr:N-acetyl-gamma-glutamyl-phosphate reductase [Mariprofundaceae bacterium]